jgi:hypothetical protein
MEYCGTIRISNPKTLQSWIDRGWYQKVYLKATYLWVAEDSKQRSVPASAAELEKTRLSKIVNKFNSLNINNMEKGLNFGEVRAAKAGKMAEQDGTDRDVRIHSFCINILLLQALQNIGEKETLYLIAHIGLKLLKKT